MVSVRNGSSTLVSVNEPLNSFKRNLTGHLYIKNIRSKFFKRNRFNVRHSEQNNIHSINEVLIIHSCVNIFAASECGSIRRHYTNAACTSTSDNLNNVWPFHLSKLNLQSYFDKFVWVCLNMENPLIIHLKYISNTSKEISTTFVNM